MPFFDRIHHLIFPEKEKEPAQAYDLWSSQYDAQPDNLMLDLDEKLVGDMLKDMPLKGRHVVDMGCGTGRHWKKLLAYDPAELMGYDVSEGMLKRLQQKFPGAKTYLIKDDTLTGIPDHSCDVIISTLTVAHIENIEQTLAEWDRILRPGGDVLITDYHPEALARGGKRTFHHKGKTVAVKNYVHFVEAIRAIAGQLHWKELRFTEMQIDDSMKHWYEKQNALVIFEKFRDTNIIYGLHLKKMNGTQ